MNRTWVILLLAAAPAVGAACGSQEPARDEPLEPGQAASSEPTGTGGTDETGSLSDVPGDAESADPAGSEPQDHGESARERLPDGAACRAPDPDMAPPASAAAAIWNRPLTVEDTGRHDEDEGKTPAQPPEAGLPGEREPDRELVAKQQRYLDAWRAQDAKLAAASAAERESARAALKQKLLGE